MKYNLSIVNFVIYFINREFHGGLVPYPFPRNGAHYVERRNRGHDFQARLSSTSWPLSFRYGNLFLMSQLQPNKTQIL